MPGLPDIVTEGQTREEALAMAKDAIDSYLEAVGEEGWAEICRADAGRVTATA